MKFVELRERVTQAEERVEFEQRKYACLEHQEQQSKAKAMINEEENCKVEKAHEEVERAHEEVQAAYKQKVGIL